MAIIFNCPHCRELYRLKDDAAGKSAKCRKCGKTITAPKPVSAAEAEALALQALLEEPTVAKADAPIEKFKFACDFCGAEHEVERSQEGKNMRCGECGKIVRVPKVIKDKPADWRETNDGRPTLAKRDAPKLEGATEAAKMVSAEAVKEAGGFDYEEEEDPRDRRIRRIKQLVYGSMTLILLTTMVWYIVRERRVTKQVNLMEKALKEIEDPNEGSKRLDFHAAIHRYAGEYYVRSAKGRTELDAATSQFKQALGKLQKSQENRSDHAAMLMELSAAMTVLGGEPDQIKDEKRLPWDQVRRMIQQPFVQADPVDDDQRDWGTRLLTRAFVASGQGSTVYSVARYAYGGKEAECAGRIGLEFLLMNQKELAAEMLKKAPKEEAPALTAFRLAMNQPPDAEAALTPSPPPQGDIMQRSLRAYAEALAFQGKIAEAKELADRPVNPPIDRARALISIAPFLLDLRKSPSEAGAILETAANILLGEPKDAVQPGWLMVRAAGLSARAGKWELAQKIAEGITNESIQAWAYLEILRVRLANAAKQKADESWLEVVTEPALANLAAAIGREEFARHNAAVGETSYVNLIEKSWPKGILRPFGYAGAALGNQDRTIKP